ncbi:glycosyltransferase [Flavobacterium sp. MEB061]|uniref:glycosyltransferase n=1 Tax=Flavobacterium sp. MEB061 TaxID=1587524 RepID=UPI0013F49875|nr:glycosyltransferase [Flavobacterium sp. MEB061]
MGKPLVSVTMITYGHEKFIEEAINGVLMQECNFCVELIIVNDCSPDSTDDIIQNIIKKHPRGNWIKYISHKKNIGMMPNFVFALNEAKSKYIALCEGDDYWTDSLKLQKQVDFLCKNEDYGLIYTNANIFNQMENKFTGTFSFINNEAPKSGDFFPSILLKNYVQTLTVLVKNEYLIAAIQTIGDSINEFNMGDYPLWIEISRITKFKYLDEVMAVYRVTPNSASSYSNLEKRYDFLQSTFDMQFYFCKKYSLFEIYEKIQTNYSGFLCNKVFDLNIKYIDKNILNSFKPVSIRDRIIKLSLSFRWVYKISKVLLKLNSLLKKNVNIIKI